MQTFTASLLQTYDFQRFGNLKTMPDQMRYTPASVSSCMALNECENTSLLKISRGAGSKDIVRAFIPVLSFVLHILF